MAERDEVVRQARHGQLLGDWYPARATDRARPAGGAPSAAPPSAATGARRRPVRRRTKVPALDLIERELVVDTFATLVEGLYAHLPLKRARYATDPLQRLRILRQRLGQLDDLAFHYELAAVITELRDAHTRYIGPASLEGKAAMLPFLVESFGETVRQRYVVSKVADDPELVPDPSFEPGVELRWWNAVPIDVAVDRQADQETGGRPDSRRARALESLTLRALQFAPPPAEHWVIVGYVDRDGVEREARFDWRVVSPRRARTAGRPSGPGGLAYAIDSAAEVARRVKKLLFAPTAWFEDTRPQPQATRRRAAALRSAGAAADPDDWLPTDFQDTVAARAVRTPSGRFGYLRLWSFDVTDDVAYVEEVARLLRLLPAAGPDHRPAGQPRWPHLGRRARAPAPHTEGDRAHPVLAGGHPADPGDGPGPAEQRGARAVA